MHIKHVIDFVFTLYNYSVDRDGYMWARGVLWSRMAVLTMPGSEERIGVLAPWFDYFNHNSVCALNLQLAYRLV